MHIKKHPKKNKNEMQIYLWSICRRGSTTFRSNHGINPNLGILIKTSSFFFWMIKPPSSSSMHLTQIRCWIPSPSPPQKKISRILILWGKNPFDENPFRLSLNKSYFKGIWKRKKEKKRSPNQFRKTHLLLRRKAWK